MTIKGTAEVTLIRENPDGSADYQFNFPQEALDALTRLGIITALKAGIEEGDQLNPQEPVKREWVGLTDEAIWLKYQRFWPFHPADEPRLAQDIAKFARAIEAKLREKNT